MNNMKNKMTTLFAGLALCGGFSLASVTAQAADQPAQQVQISNGEPQSLKKVGDKAPDKYMRQEFKVNDWKQKGLAAPEADAQWVKIEDKYVQVKTVNGVIVAIVPVKK